MSKHIERVQPGEKIFDWLLLLLSIGILFEAFRIDGGLKLNSAGSFPVGLGLVMLASSLAILFSHRYKRRAEHLHNAAEEFRAFISDHFKPYIVVFSVAAILYLAAIVWFSFYLSTAVFLATMFIFLRRGKIISSLVITALATGVIYALFTLVFRVYLP